MAVLFGMSRLGDDAGLILVDSKEGRKPVLPPLRLGVCRAMIVRFVGSPDWRSTARPNVARLVVLVW